jgi:hypothetical protein
MQRIKDVTVAALGVGVILWTIHIVLREEPSITTAVTTGESADTDQGRQRTATREEIIRRNNEYRESVERDREEWLRKFEEDQRSQFEEEQSRLEKENLRQRLQVPSDPAPYGARRSTGTASESRRSEVDRKRDGARRELAALFGRIGPAADRLFQDVDNHLRICGNETQGQCRLSVENIVRQAVAISVHLADAQELARTSWLPPGEVRELRKQNGLSDGVWDRLISLVNRYAR